MSTSVETVSEQTLASLVANGNVKSVSAVESANGRFAVRAKTKKGEVTLRSHREQVRTFASLDTMRRFFHDKLGVVNFDVKGLLGG